MQGLGDRVSDTFGRDVYGFIKTITKIVNKGHKLRDVIRRLCKDLSSLIRVHIDQMLTYSTSDNFVLRHLSVSSVHRSGGERSVNSFSSTFSMKQCILI